MESMNSGIILKTFTHALMLHPKTKVDNTGFYLLKKGYINFVPKSVRRLSVWMCVRHLSCKYISF